MQKIGKAAKVGAFALGTVLAGAAVVGFRELAESQKVSAQTAAALKSTGNAAKISAEEIEGMASRLSHLSGVDDEVIQSSENLLLTFTNVKNEMKDGNMIFDLATQAILDMSVAMGKDLNSTTLMVGKALNNPIKGLTALTRVGVNFTDKQKKWIEGLIEAGRTADAQKVILRELNKEFGGSAKAAGATLPGKLNKLKNSFEETSGKLIESLIPTLEILLGKLEQFAGWAEKNPDKIKLIAAAAAGLTVALIALSVASTIAAAGLTALYIASGVGAIVALAAAVVIAYQRFETFRKVVDTVVGFVARHWKLLLALIPVIGPLLAVVVTKFKVIKNTAESVFGAVRTAVQWVIDKVTTLIGWVKTLIGWIEKIDMPNLNPFRGGGSGGTPEAPGSRPPGSNPNLDNSSLRLAPRGGSHNGGVGTVVLKIGERELGRALLQMDQNKRRLTGGRGILAT